jgi:hypothetical protein
VRSSTFNSETATGARSKWHLDFIYALALVVAIFAIAEVALRFSGYRPSAPDDMKLWAFERSRVYGQKPGDVMVIIGASRSRLGLHTETLRQAYPGVRVVQLALNATSPFAVLRDLAEDRAFNGLIIYDLMERYELPTLAEGASPFVSYFHHEQSPSQRAERWLRSLYLGHLAVLSPQFDPKTFAKAIAEQHAFPRPFPVQYLADRSGIARANGAHELGDTNAAAATLEKGLIQERDNIDADGWMAFHQRVEQEAAKLRSRGGQVVFLRMPSSGRVWDIENRYFPKREFWDRMKRETQTPALHFLDVPEWCNLTLYDESHLDEGQSRDFTRRFGEWLLATKVATNSSS